MAITIDSLITDVHEYGEDLSNKFSWLWDSLLDDDNGISEEAYDRLVILGNIIDPQFVSAVAKYVESTDGRFYVKGERT